MGVKYNTIKVILLKNRGGSSTFQNLSLAVESYIWPKTYYATSRYRWLAQRWKIDTF